VKRLRLFDEVVYDVDVAGDVVEMLDDGQKVPLHDCDCGHVQGDDDEEGDVHGRGHDRDHDRRILKIQITYPKTRL
jgi:acetone carboxylase gamma subunit